MLGQWKKIVFIVVLAGIIYAGCNTQGILRQEKFFREKNPNLALTPKVCYFLGNISYLTFRYKLALNIIERNLKDFPYAPGRVDAEYRRAICYEKLGNYDKAITLYENFLLDYPKDNRYKSIQSKATKLKALHKSE